MPSFRIEPSEYLANVSVEFREDLVASGVHDLIKEVLTDLYNLFIAGRVPEDLLGWTLERCGVPPVDPQVMKDLEKERDELHAELMMYKKKEKEEKERKEAENIVKQ